MFYLQKINLYFIVGVNQCRRNSASPLNPTKHLNLQMSIYMSIVVYAPALALSQVTGMNKYLSCTLICFVCIFYTTLGGMKAVLWTDTIQVKSSYLVHLDVRMSVYICRLFAEIPRTKIKYLPIV